MADRFGRPEPKSKWDRSLDYRNLFLKTNKGLFGCIYICAYCGKPLLRKNMQVDHHIAINLVRNNPLYKVIFGIRNTFQNMFGRISCAMTGKKFVPSHGVNVSYNLLPACQKCNNRKSDKGGAWIARGFIGGTIWKALNAINNFFIWAWSKPAFRIAFLCAVAFILFQYFFTGAGILFNVIAGIKNFFEMVETGIAVGLGMKVSR
ncbi:MAG: HNH endonuclease signature motif containing protein [Clostridia bacterium]